MNIEQIQKFYQAVLDSKVEYRMNYNIAPTEHAMIAREGKSHDRHIGLARFGTPMTMQGKNFPLINLQSEKVSSREGFKTRRCVIPAAGFYEWEKVSPTEKQPYYFSPVEGFFSFAGIWSANKEETSFSILTTAANDVVGPIHARMPVILLHNAVGEWLSHDANPSSLTALLQPLPDSQMQKWKVSKAVNSPRNKDAACINSL